MQSHKICGHWDSQANTSTSFLWIRTKTDHWEKMLGENLSRKEGVEWRARRCDEFLFISLATMARLNCLQYVLSPAPDEQYQFGQTQQIFSRQWNIFRIRQRGGAGRHWVRLHEESQLDVWQRSDRAGGAQRCPEGSVPLQHEGQFLRWLWGMERSSIDH